MTERSPSVPDLDQILRRLRTHLPELRERFGAERLAVFGSVARGEVRSGIDVDLLVAFRRPPGFDGYMALKWRLEELLGCPVDLVMERALKDEARAVVESEAVAVA